MITVNIHRSLDVLRPERHEPHRIKSKLHSPALASWRTTWRGSVNATFQLGAVFGVGRCDGIEKTLGAVDRVEEPEPRKRQGIGRATTRALPKIREQSSLTPRRRRSERG
jgi:hypothetical protein